MSATVNVKGTIMQKVYEEAILIMQPAIDILLNNFRGNKIDEAEQPTSEIECFLSKLDIYYPGADKLKLKLAIRQYITSLSCFKYRTIAKYHHKVIAVWNPLEKSLIQFLDEHNQCEIITEINQDNYPTNDIIVRWVDSNIDECMSKN